MKKLFYIFMLLISAQSFNAQITLAGQTNDYSPISNNGLKMIHLNTGYHFVQQVDSFAPGLTSWFNFIRIYDLNLNPVKNIPLPTFNWPGYNQTNSSFVSFVSDHLFNADNSIEFVVRYNASSIAISCPGGVNVIDSSNLYVMNESGAILAKLANYTSCSSSNGFNLNYYSDGSTFSKLLVNCTYINISSLVYNLPGFLPCESCSLPTGFSSQGANSADGMKVNVLPNPSSGDFTFQYTLPKDKQNGELTITDIGGSQVKTVNITNQSGSVSVNMSDLSSGVYIFQLKSGTSQSLPQKIILAK